MDESDRVTGSTTKQLVAAIDDLRSGIPVIYVCVNGIALDYTAHLAAHLAGDCTLSKVRRELSIAGSQAVLRFMTVESNPDRLGNYIDDYRSL